AARRHSAGCSRSERRRLTAAPRPEPTVQSGWKKACGPAPDRALGRRIAHAPRPQRSFGTASRTTSTETDADRPGVAPRRPAPPTIVGSSAVEPRPGRSDSTETLASAITLRAAAFAYPTRPAPRPAIGPVSLDVATGLFVALIGA